MADSILPDALGDLVSKVRRSPAVRLEDPAVAELGKRYLTWLAEGRYAEILALAEALGPLAPHLSERRDMVAAHARLALTYDRAAELAAARERERSSRWLTTESLLDRLKCAVREQRPYAFLRVGEGEARFLIALHAELRPGLSMSEAWAPARFIWHNWFGERIDSVDPALLSSLMTDIREAVREADVLGVSNAELLLSTPQFYGYLAAQESWLRRVLADCDDILFTGAIAHHRLDELSPFLEDLLVGLDFLGVVGPHADLAKRLGSRFGIPATCTYLVPSASLPFAAEPGNGERHFPERYREIMTTLAIPRPGAVFLVGAGPLGKVYCARIKERGGIAIDIGSVGDYWMGFNTRTTFRKKPGVALDPSP